MQRPLLSSLAIAASLLVRAQLAPGTEAPLIAHLTEVNAQWPVMDPAPADAATPVHFRTDAQRIALHLHRVHDFLAAHTPQGLTTAAAAQRAFLLDKLSAYADRGVFPINDVVAKRNPVFIDRVGTACAVGQLMIESGHRDLAQRIHDEMNLAYVHDMHRADVDQWAVAHGFTENELAWIQPGYAPNVPWIALGDGTDQVVQATLRLSTGDLLVAGQFSHAGGVACNRVALWTGGTYTPMPGFPQLFGISCAAELNGTIYVGGAATDASGYDLMKWNGTTWTGEDVFAGKSSQDGVQDLFVHDGMLYASGSSTGIVGTSYGVQRLNGSTWEPVGQQLNSFIQSIDYFDGHLVCGGSFTANFPTQANNIVHVAYLNGNTWTQLGAGLNGTVNDLLVDGNMLYAGGDCVAEVATYFGLARIPAGSDLWEQLMPNIGTYMDSPTDGLVGILDMVANNGHIYLGGNFGCFEAMTTGMGVAVFNGDPDDVHPYCAFGGTVYDVEILDIIDGQQLVAAGTGAPYSNIAVTDLSTGIGEHGTAALPITVWPNPATDLLLLNSTTARTAHVLDAAGRVVLATPLRNGTNALDVRALASGPYLLRVADGDGVRTARFVKQ